MHYYQFNIGDYASHTRYLTQLEDLGYRRLLDLYYLSERALPVDASKVARLVGMSECFGEIEAVLLEFFKLTDKGWVNKRADEDIAKYHSKADAARANGKKGGRPKTQEKPKRTQPVNSANPEITGSKANHKPLTNNHKPLTITKNIVASAPDWAEDYIEQFWLAYPKKVDKKKSIERLRKLIKANPDKHFFTIILNRIKTKCAVTEPKFWPTADRYLRDEKWEDEIINQGDSHGQPQASKKPSSAVDRVRQAVAEKAAAREAAGITERSINGQALADDGGHVRTQVCEPVRGDSTGYLGEVLEGDFRATNS